MRPNESIGEELGVPAGELASIARFDPESDDASRELVTAVARAEGADPTELEPLASAIDPDALDAMFRSSGDGTAPGTDAELYFAYAGYLVRIRGNGRIALHRREEA